MSSSNRWISPLNYEVELKDVEMPLWKVELIDFCRGFCGALFLALPLLYTSEVWERARALPKSVLIGIVIITYFCNAGFATYQGFKTPFERRNIWFDPFSAMGIGLLASTITLFLVARYTFDTPPDVCIKLLMLEMVPTSFGASLAINQLGSTKLDSNDQETLESNFPGDIRMILGTFLGALTFAFNIAPTIEPKVLVTSITMWHILAIALFSFFVSYLMVFVADFSGNADRGCRFFCTPLTETSFAYLVSLGVSGLSLWMFGYIGSDSSLQTAVPWIIVMGYSTTLGGSAGRLIL